MRERSPTGSGTIADRVRSTVAFPLVVFAVWRGAQFVLAYAFGARSLDSAFQWDAGFYRRIFESGYHLAPGESRAVTAFFPGLPWVTRVVAEITPSRRLAELLTVNLAAAAAFVAVWGVAKCWRGPEVARRAVVLIAVFPSSLFLWAYYSEGLFIALGAGAVWADQRGRHRLAAVLFAGVTVMRPIGLTVGLAVVLSRVLKRRRLDWVSCLYLGATAVGLLAVMAAQWDDMGQPLSWLSAQKYWRRELRVPWAWVTDGIRAITHSQKQRVLDPFLIIAVAATVVYAWRDRGRPWPVEAWLLPIAFLAVPILAPAPLSSLNRFVLETWPSFVIGADMLGRTPRWVRWIVIAGAALVSVAWARYWAHGNFVG